jgi:alpha-L-fucosidase
VEAFFTGKGETLYAITPWWPAQRFVLKDVPASPETVVTMLGLPGRLNWQTAGRDLVVEVPKLSVDEVPCPYAYVLKVTPVNRGGEIG